MRAWIKKYAGYILGAAAFIVVVVMFWVLYKHQDIQRAEASPATGATPPVVTEEIRHATGCASGSGVYIENVENFYNGSGPVSASAPKARRRAPAPPRAPAATAEAVAPITSSATVRIPVQIDLTVKPEPKVRIYSEPAEVRVEVPAPAAAPRVAPPPATSPAAPTSLPATVPEAEEGDDDEEDMPAGPAETGYEERVMKGGEMMRRRIARR